MESERTYVLFEGAQQLTEKVRAVTEYARSRREKLAANFSRYSLALVFLWIGAMKFTAYEAEGIQGLIASSPLMSWAYYFGGVWAVSEVIGVVEILVGLMIAVRPWSARISAAGSLLACGTFLVTLTFLASTPGVWEPDAGGFPALSVIPGQFLLKDLPLLGVSIWTCAEAWTHRHDDY